MPIKKPGKPFKKKYAGAKTLNKMMKAPVTDAVKKYVKKTLDNRLENKVANFYINGEVLWNITNDIAPWRTDNIFFLSPQLGASQGVSIAQGTGQAQRIGNKISIKKATIRLVLYPLNVWALGYQLPVNVNMYIFKTRRACDVATVRSQIEQDFFQLGSNSLGLTGTLTDNVLNVNNDVFIMHKFKCFKLGVSQNDTNLQAINNDYKYNQQYSIDVTKYLKSSYVFNDNDTEAFDNYTICMFSVVPADNILSGGGSDVCQISYNYEIQYEDA